MTSPKPSGLLTFTDDDLRRLKEVIQTTNHNYNISHQTLIGVIERLEASEKLAVTMEETARYDDCNFCIATESDEGELHYVHYDECPLMAEIKAWRKSKGV